MPINHNDIAKDIMAQYKIITFRDTKESYYWNPETKVYEDAETLIEELVQTQCTDDTTCHNVAETIKSIKRQTFMNRDDFKVSENLIPLQNGLYDLKEKKLIDYSTEHYLFYKHPVLYDSTATCPLIDKTFNELVEPKDVPALYEIAGYCLYRKYPIQKFFLFIGGSYNGKSTLINLYINFLGTQSISSVPMQELADDKFATCRLYGKNANLYADLDKSLVKNPGKLKLLTGSDRIPAQKKHKDGFEFWNYAKLIFSANNPPKIEDDSDAIWRRMHLIIFPNSFEGKDDISLGEKMNQELSGFLNKALEGLEKCLSANSFSGAIPKDELREYYHRLTDSAFSFIDEACEFNVDYKVSKVRLYAAYRIFCKDKRLPLMPDKGFYNSLRHNFGEKIYEGRDKDEMTGEFRRIFKGVWLLNGGKDSPYSPKE